MGFDHGNKGGMDGFLVGSGAESLQQFAGGGHDLRNPISNGEKQVPRLETQLLEHGGHMGRSQEQAACQERIEVQCFYFVGEICLQSLQELDRLEDQVMILEESETSAVEKSNHRGGRGEKGLDMGFEALCSGRELYFQVPFERREAAQCNHAHFRVWMLVGVQQARQWQLVVVDHVAELDLGDQRIYRTCRVLETTHQDGCEPWVEH